MIVFNHVYQHYVFYIVKYISDCHVSMNINIQGLTGTGKTCIVNTIRDIDINLNPMFFIIYLLCSDRMCYFINQ